MTLTFAEFIARYNDGSITDDAAWRAYSIEAMAGPHHAYAALSLVHCRGRRGRRHHPFHAIAGAYGLGSPARAEHLLGLWYVWRAIAMGEAKRAVLREGT